MATAPKVGIDVNIHNRLTGFIAGSRARCGKGLTPAESVFPQYSEKLAHPGPITLDIRFTEHAHDHSIATGHPINETPTLVHAGRWKALAPVPGRFALQSFLAIASRGGRLGESQPRCEGKA